MTEENKQKIINMVNRLYLFKDEITNEPTHIFGDHISNRSDFLRTLDKISYLLKHEDDR